MWKWLEWHNYQKTLRIFSSPSPSEIFDFTSMKMREQYLTFWTRPGGRFVLNEWINKALLHGFFHSIMKQILLHVPYGSALIAWFHSISSFHVVDSMMCYFSVWNLLLVFIYFISNTPFLYPMVLQTSLQCSIGGFYLTYITPRYYEVPYLNLLIDGTTMNVMDALAHHLPLLLVLRKKKKYDKDKRTTSLLLLQGSIPSFLYCAYLLWKQKNPFLLYHIQPPHVLFIETFSYLVAYLLF